MCEREWPPASSMLLPLSLNKYTQTQTIRAQRGPAASKAVCLCPAPWGRQPAGWSFAAPQWYLFKRRLCCCLHSFFGTYLGQVDGNPDSGENVALSIFARFSDTVSISICLPINTLPSPLTLAFPPFFPHFLFSFSFSSADVDLEEAGKEGGKSREVMRLNKEGKWSSWHFSVSLCGSLHRLWNIM